MNITEVIFMAFALAMDALAVSVCKGMTLKEFTVRHTLRTGLYFGGFQMLMPIVGFFIGSTFSLFSRRTIPSAAAFRATAIPFRSLSVISLLFVPEYGLTLIFRISLFAFLICHKLRAIRIYVSRDARTALSSRTALIYS